jgi:hypothetical protein
LHLPGELLPIAVSVNDSITKVIPHNFPCTQPDTRYYSSKTKNIFSGNFVAYFEISDTGTSTLTGNSYSTRQLESTELSATFTDCMFFNNTVQSAMVGTSGSNVDVSISQTYWVQNTAGSLLWFMDGSWSVDETCSVDNAYSLGIIVATTPSSSFVANQNYASNVAFGPVCNEGIMILSDYSLKAALNMSTYTCDLFPSTTCFGPLPERLVPFSSGTKESITTQNCWMMWTFICMWHWAMR